MGFRAKVEDTLYFKHQRLAVDGYCEPLMTKEISEGGISLLLRRSHRVSALLGGLDPSSCGVVAHRTEPDLSVETLRAKTEAQKAKSEADSEAQRVIKID